MVLDPNQINICGMSRQKCYTNRDRDDQPVDSWLSDQRTRWIPGAGMALFGQGLQGVVLPKVGKMDA